LNLDLSQINSINDISDAENQINEAKTVFEERKETLLTYNSFIIELQKSVELTADELNLFHTNDDEKVLNLKVVLEKMNQLIQGDDVLKTYNEKWDINSNDQEACPYSAGQERVPHDEIITYNLKKCNPLNRKWIGDLSNDHAIKENAQIISDILDLVNEANKEGQLSGQDVYYHQTLEDLKEKYREYLQSYINALNKFKSAINRITGQLNEYTGGAGAFSFANCSFIGTNLKIILKYLKEVFGGDIYTIGVCLILVGCSLALSISSTILLIIIINISIDEDRK
jgi:hypothetical protein